MNNKCINCEYETNELYEDNLCSACYIDEQEQNYGDIILPQSCVDFDTK